MSHTRNPAEDLENNTQSGSISDQKITNDQLALHGKQSNNDFIHYYMKSICIGLLVGPVSSTLTFPIDKIAFAFQTIHNQHSPSFKQALSVAFDRPFNGYLPGVLNSSFKNIVMFPFKALFERQLESVYPNSSFNTKLAAFFAGIITVYITSPISVIKALRYHNMPVNEIRQLDTHSLFRGVHTTAMRDGVQFGMFFAVLPYISNYVSNPALSGGVAGLVGSLFSNPLSVIAMNQKVNGTRFIEEAVALKNEGGLTRFYRGFFRTTALRMGIQGAATGTVIHAAEKIYDYLHEEQNAKRKGFK